MKIMLLTAATGGGHLRAAHAVEQYIRDNTDCDVVTVDALKAIGRLLDKTVCDSYLFMAKKVPALFGRLYKRTNKQNRFSGLVPKLSGLFSNLLLPAIAEYQPDVIITTHPFATEMVSDLKEDGLVAAPLICIITDYGVHRAYIAEHVSAYVVASEDMIPELMEFGVAAEKVYPFGIPVHGVFFDPGDREGLLQELKLDPDLPTLLFMAGSFGVSNIIKLYRSLESTDVRMQIIVITGRNKKLYEAFEKELAVGSRIPSRAALRFPRPWPAVCPWRYLTPFPARRRTTPTFSPPMDCVCAFGKTAAFPRRSPPFSGKRNGFPPCEKIARALINPNPFPTCWS